MFPIGSTPMANLYPDDAYVDVLGLDGYNWGSSPALNRSWQSPEQVLGAGIAELRTVAPTKPIIIAETASAEEGGSKAEWNKRLISYLNAQPDVYGFVWFNLNKEADWRINSSESSASAFKAALDSREASTPAQ